MRNLICLIILLLFSCDTKESSSTVDQADESEFTYMVITKDNNKYISYLIEDINDKVGRSVENKEIVLYDSLTKDYLQFVTDIESGIKKNTSAILFDGERYSETGKQFIGRTKKYKAAIEGLITSENLKKRINLTINTNDVKQLNGEVSDNNETGVGSDGIRLIYLEYYFKGLSNNQVLAHLSSKKKTILEIENEYIESKQKE